MYDKKSLLLFLLMCCLLAMPSAYALQTQISKVRYWSEPDYNRIVFDVSNKLQYKLFELENPPRLVIDFKDTHAPKKLDQPTQSEQLITELRSGIRGKQDTRVVVDLKGKSRFQTFYLAPRKQYGHRLVVDVYQHPSVQLAKQSSGSTFKTVKSKTTGKVKTAAQTKTNQVVSRKQSKTFKPIVIAKKSAKSPKVVKPRKTEAIRKQSSSDDIVIAIDAGHGGKDPGATGLHKTREKDVVLAIAKKLAAYVDGTPGMRSYLVRDGDYFVPLRDRMKKARKAKADMFISIHADALANRAVKGSTVYTLSARGAEKEARRWSRRQNQADLATGVSLRDKDSQVASVLLDLSQTNTQEQSKDVATKIFAHLKKNGPVLRKSVQKKPYMVLKAPDIPSVLVETAFISNPRQERSLKSSTFQAKMARSIFNGIRDYFSEQQATGTYLAASSHKIRRGETLSEIAQHYGVSIREIRKVNRLSSSRILVGQVLKIRPDV